MTISEERVINTIVIGSDWRDVLSTLVAEEGMDPVELDIVELADAFRTYLYRLKKFDFRVPARFILVAAILLRMKAEILLEKEEKHVSDVSGEKVPPLNIDNIEILSPPVQRKPTRKVTLSELIGALNKAFDFKEKKQSKKLRMRRAVETLIEPEEDIEIRIGNIYKKIVQKRKSTFSDIVPAWRKVDIVTTFLPLLHLCQRSQILMDQPDMFREIYIELREEEDEEEQTGAA